MRIALALAVLALGSEEAAAQTRFGAWFVGCDNRRDCRAMGFPGRVGVTMGALALERAADAAAPPALWISADYAGDRPVSDGTRVEIMADDTRLGAVTVSAGLVARDNERLIFDVRDEALARTILDALQRARRLRFVFAGGPTLDISLDGAGAALRALDDRQRRVDTVTALIRRGDRPPSAVPAPPALPPEPQTRADPGWRAGADGAARRGDAARPAARGQLRQRAEPGAA